jgi:RecA-family ATPase
MAPFGFGSISGLKAENGEQPDRDIRELEFKKNQYEPTDATIILRYDNQKGMFLPIPKASSAENLRSDADAEDAFLNCLDTLATQGRRVGTNPGKNFAPAVFLKTGKANGFTSGQLEGAMERLFRQRRDHRRQKS